MPSAGTKGGPRYAARTGALLVVGYGRRAEVTR